jgi:aspartyl-tRNA(Asn)/glutamyl-tRNA(Gln) amidotransferase subunit C
MAVTINDVRSVAALARLRFTPEEEEVLTGELNGILEYVEKLNELDTEGVETTSHVLPMVNAFRKDEAEPFSSLDGLKASAPSIQDGYFRVPRIID